MIVEMKQNVNFLLAATVCLLPKKGDGGVGGAYIWEDTVWTKGHD